MVGWDFLLSILDDGFIPRLSKSSDDWKYLSNPVLRKELQVADWIGFDA